MKKLFLAALVALISIAGFAQGVVKVNFDSMKISEDAGKTWSEAVKINGQFIIDGEKTISLILGSDKQGYSIKKSEVSDDKTTLSCTDSDGEVVTVVFAPKSKEITLSSSLGVTNFKITKIDK